MERSGIRVAIATIEFTPYSAALHTGYNIVFSKKTLATLNNFCYRARLVLNMSHLYALIIQPSLTWSLGLFRMPRFRVEANFLRFKIRSWSFIECLQVTS